MPEAGGEAGEVDVPPVAPEVADVPGRLVGAFAVAAFGPADEPACPAPSLPLEKADGLVPEVPVVSLKEVVPNATVCECSSSCQPSMRIPGVDPVRHPYEWNLSVWCVSLSHRPADR